jgi:hypothetical protein
MSERRPQTGGRETGGGIGKEAGAGLRYGVGKMGGKEKGGRRPISQWEQVKKKYRFSKKRRPA